MSRTLPKPLLVLLGILALFSLLLLAFLNRSLADLASWIYPGSGLAVHLVLAGLELLAVLWFWRGLFGGQKHLLLLDAESPEELRRFHAELMRRMRRNLHVRQAGLAPPPADGAKAMREYTDACLALLNGKADEEIRQAAKRAFLATALAQNGKLDALIMLVSLCRLVWRVSSIYNQRPHPREILSLYWTVASTAFLAFSIEELDLSTEITVGFGESFQAMAPAGLTASLPFAGRALQTFTSATIDGAANCYLALRAGIITRNAYAYSAIEAKRPGRADVFREAGAILLDMSQSLVERFAAVLAESLGGAAKQAARYAGETTLQTGKNIVQGVGKVGQGIGSSAEKIATGAAGIVQTTGSTLTRAGGQTGAALAHTADSLAGGAANAVRHGGDLLKAGAHTAAAAVKLASDTGNALKNTGSAIVQTSADTASTLLSTVRNGTKTVWRVTGLSREQQSGSKGDAAGSPHNNKPRGKA